MEQGFFVQYVDESYSKPFNKLIDARPDANSNAPAKGEVEAFTEHKIRSLGMEHLSESMNVALPNEMTKQIDG